MLRINCFLAKRHSLNVVLQSIDRPEDKIESPKLAKPLYLHPHPLYSDTCLTYAMEHGLNLEEVVQSGLETLLPCFAELGLHCPLSPQKLGSGEAARRLGIEERVDDIDTL